MLKFFAWVSSSLLPAGYFSAIALTASAGDGEAAADTVPSAAEAGEAAGFSPEQAAKRDRTMTAQKTSAVNRVLCFFIFYLPLILNSKAPPRLSLL
jgi:hypothetical protein